MSRAYIQLARVGDILNVLPMLWADAQKGERDTLIVGQEYAPLLEGVSYCDVLTVEAPHDIPAAVELAESKGLEWVCTQVNAPLEYAKEFVYGPANLDRAVTTSFQKEMWRVAGRLSEFGLYPLVFDKRDKTREYDLYKRTVTKKGKIILVAPSGISSPFPFKDLLLELVRHCGYQVIDLSQVKAERFYDLLVLFEAAIGLVSIDTAALHLAMACPNLPVIALVNDKPLLWNGSSWRGQHEFYCRYSDFPMRAMEMVGCIKSLRSFVRWPMVTHVWNAVNGDDTTASLEGWKEMPILPGMCARLGPPSKPEHPYLRDVIRMALQRTTDSASLCITGPRVSVNLGSVSLPAYAYRMIDRVDGMEFSPIADLFMAPGSWWREHLDEIPDVLFANDYYWRHCLWALFRTHGGVDITPAITTTPTPPKTGAPISPAAAFNSPICDAFIKTMKVTSRYPKVTDQLPCRTFEPSGLKPFGYNPTIIEHDDMILMAYRYHPQPDSPSSRLVISQIDLDGAVLSNREPDFNCKSGEDPKLFRGPSTWPWMSYVASSLPHLPARAVVRYTELVNGKPQDLVTPNIGHNDETAIEKNWVMWGGLLYFAVLYQCHPTHQVYTKNGNGWTLHETPAPKWPWGPIKGGTPPVLHDGKLLRFFHSTTEKEFGPHPRRYYVGALLMEPKPPFKVLRVSSKPILYGSEIDDVRVKDRPPHWKANVVFPGGAIPKGDGWILAVGVNDCQCVLAKVGENDLNL